MWHLGTLNTNQSRFALQGLLCSGSPIARRLPRGIGSLFVSSAPAVPPALTATAWKDSQHLVRITGHGHHTLESAEPRKTDSSDFTIGVTLGGQLPACSQMQITTCLVHARGAQLLL